MRFVHISLFCVNFVLAGYGILALGYPIVWDRLPYCLVFIAAGLSSSALIGNLHDPGPFGPPVAQIAAILSALSNLALTGIGVAFLLLVDLPSSALTASVVIAIGVLNLGYIILCMGKIRSSGFPDPK